STATITGIMIEKTSPGRKPRRLLGNVRGLGVVLQASPTVCRSSAAVDTRIDTKLFRQAAGCQGFRRSSQPAVSPSQSMPACGWSPLRQRGRPRCARN
ncbi:MAG: hypothetical protein ACK53L_12435, partial [Pirellulaceae bacterium]